METTEKDGVIIQVGLDSTHTFWAVKPAIGKAGHMKMILNELGRDNLGRKLSGEK